MSKIRVLIIDDAVVIRRIVSDVLGEDPDIEVVGTAANGKIGIAKIPQVNPDLVTLDVEMPDMDGLQTLRELRKINRKLPVIMFSTLTSRGASATLDALAAGADDYVNKPANVGSVAVAMARIRDELIPKIKALCPRSPAVAPAPVPAQPMRASLHVPRNAIVQAVTVGISTGGPNALDEIIPALPADLPVPVLIVQHMPPVFTRVLAERLNAKSPLRVKEAEAGEPVVAGTVYIAPGDYHLSVMQATAGPETRLDQSLPENSCRPAADVLMRSAAKVWGASTLGLVLTGMGQDGLRGAECIREAGGEIYVQDEATSVVWGMPAAVARAGLAAKQIPLWQVAAEVSRRVMQSRKLDRSTV